MHTHREAMVRRAVAQHIVQKVKHQRKAKRQRMLLRMPSAGISSAFALPGGDFSADARLIAPGDASWTPDIGSCGTDNNVLGISPTTSHRQCGSHDTESAIEALAAALSAVRTDPCI
ncbi:hypothetical protein GGI22_006980, partial [Coemansia erecta]